MPSPSWQLSCQARGGCSAKRPAMQHSKKELSGWRGSRAVLGKIHVHPCWNRCRACFHVHCLHTSLFVILLQNGERNCSVTLALYEFHGWKCASELRFTRSWYACMLYRHQQSRMPWFVLCAIAKGQLSCCWKGTCLDSSLSLTCRSCTPLLYVC